MKQIKKSKAKEKKEIGIRNEIRGLGVLIEHVDGNVGLVAEQYSEIKKDISVIKKTLNSHTEMIGNIAMDMTAVKTDTAVLKTDMTIVKKDIEIIKTDIEFIKLGLKKKVDIDEFAALERRVVLLENHR